MTNSDDNNLEIATFAGGCFWCMEGPFQALDGVQSVYSGYIGGPNQNLEPNPTYEDICTGKSGYIEAVQITYDPSKMTFETLLNTFWRQIDPTDPIGQFADKGSQYISAIFYHNNEQKIIAQVSKQKLENSGKFDLPVATKIMEAAEFYRAEEYHQDYHNKNPERYNGYRRGSGRQTFIDTYWKED